MRVDFFNIDIDEQQPIETVNFRDKRFINQALETGIHRSAVPHDSMKYGASCRGGVITETVRFFRKANQIVQHAAVLICAQFLVFYGLWEFLNYVAQFQGGK